MKTISPTFFAALLLSLPALADSEPALDCSSLRTPAAYCAEFSVTPALKSDPRATLGRASCEKFYASVLDSLQLLCDYDVAAAQFDAKVLAAGAKVDGASNALGVSKDTYAAAQGHWKKYRALASEKLVALQAAYKVSRDRLLELSRTGVHVLRSEVGCTTNGVPGAAPGYLLVGLAWRSAGEQWDVFQQARDALQYLYEDSSASGEQAHAVGGKAGTREKALKVIPAGTGGMAGGDLTDTHKLTGGGTERLFLGVSRDAADMLPKFWRRSGVLGIRLLAEYAKHGEVDTTLLFTTGVRVAAYSVGISGSGSLAVGLGLAWLESAIRRDMEAQEQKKWKPYVDYGATKVNENAALDSPGMAKAFEPIKQAVCRSR